MIKLSPYERSFSAFNYLFLICIGLTMLVPFVHILAVSLSGSKAVLQGNISIFPREFSLANYHAVLQSVTIWRAFGVTVLITVVGTFLSLLFTSLMAYGLSKTDLKGRSLILMAVLFTMIFQAPMIPTYLLVKQFGMLNTLWSLIIPGLISAFNLIIMISFYKNIPEGLMDAAKIDGCSEYRTWWSIVLPLSLPSLSTIGLFYAVGYWNGYAAALMYIRNPALYPLQLKLQQLVTSDNAQQMLHNAFLTIQSTEGVQMASIIVATIPILLVYPFIQKHFVKGAMLGSLKE